MSDAEPVDDATDSLLLRDATVISPSMRLRFPPLVAERGRGALLYDRTGTEYLDLHSMAGIANVGHSHPRVVAAIAEQASQLTHANPAYVHHHTVTELAERLSAITPIGPHAQVAFGLSGSDANDGALKLVRAATGRSHVISFFGSYHGNTYGALSLSAISLEMRRGFGPAVPDIHHVPFPDPYRGNAGDGDLQNVFERALHRFDEVLATVVPADEVAAVFVEPIQGDAGVIVPPEGFLSALGDRCRRQGILVVAEEVQSGMGRTGAWLAATQLGLEPDIVVLGKALAGGLPLSAIIASNDIMSAWSAPGHVFSTGANPVCCAAALATLDVIEDEQLLERSQRAGERFRTALRQLADQVPEIGDVRGRGLMIGVDLVQDRHTRQRHAELAARTIWAARRRGVFLTFLQRSVLRILPPLVIDDAQIDRAVEVLSAALQEARSGGPPDFSAELVTGW